MLAVVTDGSHQYKVKVGEAFKCNKVDLPVGSFISFSPIFLSEGDVILDDKSYSVKGIVIKQYREDKIIVFKKKRRKDFKKKRGHRSFVSLIKIESIDKI